MVKIFCWVVHSTELITFDDNFNSHLNFFMFDSHFECDVGPKLKSVVKAYYAQSIFKKIDRVPWKSSPKMTFFI